MLRAPEISLGEDDVHSKKEFFLWTGDRQALPRTHVKNFFYSIRHTLESYAGSTSRIHIQTENVELTPAHEPDCRTLVSMNSALL
jgi:hypothetical protein